MVLGVRRHYWVRLFIVVVSWCITSTAGEYIECAGDIPDEFLDFSVIQSVQPTKAPKDRDLMAEHLFHPETTRVVRREPLDLAFPMHPSISQEIPVIVLRC